jgi:hypothetical protein
MPRKDTLLAHTLAKVLVADGVESIEDYSHWRAAKLSPKAARITSFIAMWALAERELGRELGGIDEYRSYWNESERSAYRRQKEFREVWGEDNFRAVIEAVKRQMDATEARIHEKLTLGRAMSLEVAL